VTVLAAVRGRIERTRSGLRARSDRLRAELPVVDVGWRIYEKDREEHGGVLAAAIAYRLFLFVVPLIFVLVTAIGFVADAKQESPEHLAKTAGIGGVIATAVGNAGNLSTLNRILLLIGGLYATYSAAKSALHVFDASHSAIWDEQRPRLKGLAPAGAFIGVAIAGFFVITLTARLRSAVPTAGVSVTLLFAAIPFVGWVWASAHLAHRDAPTWALVPGGIVMALGVHVVHLFTVYYVSRQVTSKSETYGALGIAMAVLLWAYVVGRLVVLAAVTNAAIWERHVGMHDADVVADEPLQRWPTLWWQEMRSLWVHPSRVMDRDRAATEAPGDASGDGPAP
jgi:uncharacterized BrkB/YihY/UPF0761 family membrane protein